MTSMADLMSGSTDWFVKRRGLVRGPFTSARIRHYVIEGRLQLGDEVSNDKVSWLALGQVPEVVPPQYRRGPGVDAEAVARYARREQRRAWRGLGVASLVITVALVLALTLGERRISIPSDCGAAPAVEINWYGCQMEGAALRSVDLRRANLANVVFVGAQLAASRLSAADLSYANLHSADLSFAELNGARLLGANLQSATLANADLSGANLAFADLTGALIGGAQLQDTRLDGAIWVDGRRCEPPSVGACRP